MKTTKIIFLFACLIVSASSFAQLRYGVRGEISVNNPSIDISDWSSKIGQPAVVMFGVGGEIMLPVMDLGVEAALLYGADRMKMDFQDENKKYEVKSQFIDIPVTLKKKFGLMLPVKPVISGGLFAKIYVSDDKSNDKTIMDTFKKETMLIGLIAGAGVEIIDKVTVGANFRYILSGENRRFADADNAQKSLITVSVSAYF